MNVDTYYRVNADFSLRESLQASNSDLLRLLLPVGLRRWMFDEHHPERSGRVIDGHHRDRGARDV
jgi:hypothetical protein